MSLGGWSGRPAAARESADGEPLEVIATARLHLGLWEIRPGEVGCYGGLGLMLEEPKLLLRLTRSDRWQIDASPAVAARLTLAAETWRRARGVASLPPLKVRCEMELPEHRGLGSGTQTQVAMAWGLERFSCSPAHWQPPTTASLSRLSGRGRRSFVGLHGFLHGGFVVDRGEVAGTGQDGSRTSEACSRADSFDVPASWRVLLLQPPSEVGVSGTQEQQIFVDCQSAVLDQPQQLRRLAEQELLPALMAGDADQFGRSVYAYNRMAGSLFASVQGGPYRNAVIAQAVDGLRRLGVQGAGQSSWGPTVFGFVQDPDQAAYVQNELNRLRPSWLGTLQVVSPRGRSPS
jgi:beta-ribofuranosylaminobenzene 5'-phosphate synthase